MCMIWNVGDYREIGLKMVKGECSVIVLCGLLCDSVLGMRCFVEVGRFVVGLGGLGSELAVSLQEHVFSGTAFWLGAVGSELAGRLRARGIVLRTLAYS